MSSRFLNVSPRVYIRQKDSINILPRIPRTGYQNELGIEESKFNDVDTVIFADGSVVLAPYMISSSLAADSGFYTGSLLLTASITDRSSYFDKNVENDPIFPFKERFKSISETNNDIGFPQNLYPGFSSPESDKVAIVFDMSSINDFVLTKLKLDDSLRDPAGPLYNQQASGFAYYDHVNNQWNDVGITDRASSTTLSYDPVLSITAPAGGTMAAGDYQISGKDTEIVSQFTSSPYSIITEPLYQPRDKDALKARGYHKIGEPTSFFGAPHSPRYHAKSNESIKLSDYITAPFVVDRIEVKFRAAAFRTQDHATVGVKDFGFARDIDNYVFFVYLQNRTNVTADTVSDVSSSIRYLIAKESFCFSNEFTLDEAYLGLKPIHDVTQSFFFRMNPANATPKQVVKIEDINLSFRPKYFNQEFNTTSKFPGRGFEISPRTGSVFLKNFWYGGQYASGNLGQTFTITDTKNFNARRGSFNSITTFAKPSPRSLVSSFWEGTDDFIVTGSGFTITQNNIQTISVISSSQETPVVLFPSDELIFGIESGANSIMPTRPLTGGPPPAYEQGHDRDVLSVTGSRLIIKAGASHVIFYGSMIKQGVESLPSLNQYLGSDAVHEDIHDPGPYDQFDIAAPIALSASYVDNFITGSMLEGTRSRDFFRTSLSVPLSGTIERNVRYIDGQRTFYDTLVPPVNILSGGLEGTSTYVNLTTGITGSNVLKITKNSGDSFPFDNDRSSATLPKRYFTYEGFDGSSRIKNFDLALYVKTGMTSILAAYLTGDRSKFALFYNGNNGIYTTTTKNYEGATSLRYGLLSPRLVGPSYVFRRDRYGQIRDMLEQSRDSKTIVLIDGKETVDRAVVNAAFVSASSDISVDPDTTQCSNLNFECTSSLPFIDDGSPHNRGATPGFVTAFGPNNLIFGITGSFGYQ